MIAPQVGLILAVLGCLCIAAGITSLVSHGIQSPWSWILTRFVDYYIILLGTRALTFGCEILDDPEEFL